MTTACFVSVASGLVCGATCEPLAVLAIRAVCALEHSIQRLVLASDQNLGHLEIQAAQDVGELLRQTIERSAQAKADATPPICPVCGQPLAGRPNTRAPLSRLCAVRAGNRNAGNRLKIIHLD